MAEGSLGGDRKKMSGYSGDTLRQDALKRADSAVCGGGDFMQPPWPGVVENGVKVVSDFAGEREKTGVRSP
jgi:hypothetical protein